MVFNSTEAAEGKVQLHLLLAPLGTQIMQLKKTICEG